MSARAALQVEKVHPMNRPIAMPALACLVACGAYAYPLIDLPGVRDGAAAEVPNVDMSNIDTSSEAGADRLLRRIRDDAMARCDLRRTPRLESAAMHERQCMHNAMTRVVTQVNSAIVTARYDRVGATMIVASMSAR